MSTDEDCLGNRPELDELTRSYLAAQLSGDRREAIRLLMEEGIGRGNSVLDLHLRVIQQAQREIGRLWEQNTISVAQEHQATAVSQLALAHLYQQSIRRPSVGRSVLVACVEGEMHDVGARICADVLDLHGFDVRFLGADVPTDCLISFAERTQPSRAPGVSSARPPTAMGIFVVARSASTAPRAVPRCVPNVTLRATREGWVRSAKL
ncbi:MAG: cobalamin B12-binding domain-containing protein, partial [Myxococcaceae bacterium]